MFNSGVGVPPTNLVYLLPRRHLVVVVVVKKNGRTLFFIPAPRRLSPPDQRKEGSLAVERDGFFYVRAGFFMSAYKKEKPLQKTQAQAWRFYFMGCVCAALGAHAIRALSLCAAVCACVLCGRRASVEASQPSWLPAVLALARTHARWLAEVGAFVVRRCVCGVSGGGCLKWGVKWWVWSDARVMQTKQTNYTYKKPKSL